MQGPLRSAQRVMRLAITAHCVDLDSVSRAWWWIEQIEKVVKGTSGCCVEGSRVHGWTTSTACMRAAERFLHTTDTVHQSVLSLCVASHLGVGDDERGPAAVEQRAHSAREALVLPRPRLCAQEAARGAQVQA